MGRNNLVWIDLETTGLDHTQKAILEMAVVITDKNLKIIDPGINLVIHQPDTVLENMESWCQKQYTHSGLKEASRNSLLSLKEAEHAALRLVKKHCKKGQGLLCGNSVFLDKSFLWVHMPQLLEYLHYRIIDVSTVKELVRRWYGAKYLPKKKEKHRAREDILESIKELQRYREKVFVSPPPRS